MGAGGESGSPRVEALLQRFRKWLRREYGVQPTAAAKAEELRDTFQTILEQAGRSAIERGERAILIVDALNKCNEVALREWLPAQLPAGVTLLGTTTPGKNADHLVREGALCCRLPGLTRRSARRIIVAELHRRGRALDREDIECILRHPQSGSPAFLHALIDELCLFGKHEGLKARLQSLLRSRHASGIYGQGLRRVEIDHGRACVSRTISALCLSSEGLTESQLLAFTGVSPAAWAGIRLAVGDCLHELDGRIRPAHDLFRQAAIRRFCHSARAQERLHRRIARWLRSEPIGPTEAFELVFHTYWSRSPAMARDILLNPSTGIPVVEHVSTTNIIRLATSATKSRGGTPSRWLNHTLTGAWRRWGLSHRRSERQQRQSRWSAGINLLDVLEHSGATSLGVMALARDVVRLARSLDRGSTPETARNLAISEQRVGILALRTGQSDLALRSLVASNALAQRLARGSTDGNELGDLASSLEVLADALRVAGDTRGERRATRRSLDVARKRQRLERSADGAHDLCVGLVRSAIRAMEDGNPKRAQPLLDEAVAVVQDARGRYGERRLRGAYASAIFNQARLMLQSHRPSAALPLLDEMIEISSQDLDDLSHVEDRAQLAAGLGAKAEALLRCGDTDEARAAAQLAIRIERELLMRGNSNESLREYCVSLEMLADIEQESGRPSAAFAALSSAIDALELAERDRPLPDELSTVLREDRHRAVELADGKPWSLKASRHLEALLSGARKVSSGDRSAAGSAFLLYYLMLGVRLRKLKSPSSRTERNEIRRMAGVVLSSWKSGAASRRANGITIDDKVLAEAALQFAES
jgi:tetratricopeptide (TPR) repeat protein